MPRAPEPRRTFPVRLWRGQAGLLVTFGLFGVLIPAIASLGIRLAVRHDAPALFGSHAALAIDILSVLSFAYRAAITFAIFRAARLSDRKHAAAGRPQPWGALAMLTAGIAFAATGTVLADRLATSLSPSAQTQALLATLNRGLPRMTDADTRLDSVRLAGRALIYTATLLTPPPPGFYSALIARLMPSVCQNAASRAVLQTNDITYIYRTPAGALLGRTTVTRTDCTGGTRLAG